jgi:hypothetical protein
MLQAVYALPLGYACILVNIPMCSTCEFKEGMTLRLGNQQEVLRRTNRLVSFDTTRTAQKKKNIMGVGHRHKSP